MISFFLQVNQVDDCCKLIYEKPEYQTNMKYIILKPSGAESWIDDVPYVSRNTSLLFPFSIVVKNLTCEDLSINMFAVDYEDVE